MNFWEAKERARKKTVKYILVFFMLTLIVAVAAEAAFRLWAAQDLQANIQSQPPFVFFGFIGITFIVAGFNYLSYTNSGGGYVAKSLGAKRVDPATAEPTLRQLLNIVEELSLAASLPMPEVYVLDADEINAFAAGTSAENAAVTVTYGCLSKLNRDELQGVLAHELGHIANLDMLIGMRLAAMVMGFFIVTYIGLRLMQFGSFGRQRNDQKNGQNPLLIVGIIFLIAGAVTYLFGKILQAMVSRQREYLADASAVQYTRTPAGIAGALRKILKYQKINDMPANGQQFSHLYLNGRSSFFSALFATHPPLEKRIAAIEDNK